MTTVVIAELAANSKRDIAIERAGLGATATIERFAYTGSETDLVEACSEADVIMTDYLPFSRKVISQLHRCRLISVAATGYDTVDIEAAADCRISVCAIEEYCTDEVADHTLLLILALTRRLPEYHDQIQRQQLWQFDSLQGLRRLSQLTLGLIGFGKIGQAVARRARAFGMTVLASDPRGDIEMANSLGVSLCRLDELYSQSDIISLHCNASSADQPVIDRAAFSKMSKKPILINTARGSLVDESALLAALDAQTLSGAGLDVLTQEPPSLAGNALMARSNVLLTPHVGFYSEASIRDNRTFSTANVRFFLDDQHDKVRRYVHHAMKRVR